MDHATLVQANPVFQLRRYISSYWLYRQNTWENRKLRFLPTGCGLIAIPVEGRASWEHPTGSETIREATAFGPSNEWFDLVLEPGAVVAMVHLEEGGLRRFAGKAAESAVRSAVPLVYLGMEPLHRAVEIAIVQSQHGGMGSLSHHTIQPQRAAASIFPIMDGFFNGLLGHIDPIDPSNSALVSRIKESQGTSSVARLATILDLSVSSLERRVRSITGLTPKEFLMITRSHRLYRRLMSMNGHDAFLDIALGLGYYDQAHAIHDLVRVTGFTPGFIKKNVHAHDEHTSVGLAHVKPRSAGSGTPGRKHQ